ncbi:MAG: sigma-54 dependent transcriptional regulator [Steroidobacteraceae bacterium]|jgi:sigma-54 specific flagellar transcriptional regulator A
MSSTAAVEVKAAASSATLLSRSTSARAESANAALVHLPSGSSAPIRAVNHLIRQVAAFDSTVLILGESGTGKEVAARAVHDSSPRHDRPFIPVNCGAIPSELLESELFGHEKGAFTGALSARKGRFELAEGGTLFLDEIGDMNPSMQVKLLRVLQERTFERVGSCHSQRCDVRIIAATHRNLEESIAKGSFREDLYYRLNVVPIEMPPLRERSADLPILIKTLSERITASQRHIIRFSAAAVAALQQYRWPGNVRELGNLIERLTIQCSGQEVGVDDLPARYRPADWTASLPEATAPDHSLADTGTTQISGINFGAAPELPVAAEAETATSETGANLAPELADLLFELPAGGMDLRNHLETLERRLITSALEAAEGTVAQAARLLGLRRTTLVEKLRKYGLAAPDLAASGS